MIKVDNFSLKYGEEELIKDSSFYIESGKLVALVGRNGSGKSSLLRCIMGLQRPNSGHTVLNNRDITLMDAPSLSKCACYVSTDKVRIESLDIYGLVSSGRAPYTNWLNKLSMEDNEKILEAISYVGLEKIKNRSTAHISDGEYHRAMIARAIAQDCPVILLDEPTAFLDIPNKRALIDFLKSLCKDKNKTILFSTHDIEAISKADQILNIENNIISMVNPNEFSI